MDDLIRSVGQSAGVIGPELLLIFGASLLAMMGAFSKQTLQPTSPVRKSIYAGVAGVLLVVVGLWAHFGQASVSNSLSIFQRDAFTAVGKDISIFAGLFLLLLISTQAHEHYAAEHLACLLFVVAGVNLVAAAHDLIALFVALELISIPTYIMLFLSRKGAASLEATLKYFLLSIFSSAFLLYGMSILYGSSGSTSFAAIRESFVTPTGMVSPAMLQLACVMILAGLGFRITAVPFHFYAPDVFQGTSTSTAALLAIVPKIAGFVALIRLIWSTLLGPMADSMTLVTRTGATLLVGVAILTMTVGNLLALWQTNLRRLIAYSSVAHAGYMIVGLAIGSGDAGRISGAQAILFYLVIYTAMTLGLFGIIMMLRRAGEPIETTDELIGLGQRAPLLALATAIFLFSLTGLPPTGGFWAKFNLILAAWSAGTPLLRLATVAMALNAAIGAWYYLGLVRLMYLKSRESSATEPTLVRAAPLTVAICLSLLIVIGLFLAPNLIWTKLQV